jgi:hypothetical protein
MGDRTFPDKRQLIPKSIGLQESGLEIVNLLNELDRNYRAFERRTIFIRGA